MDALRRKLLMMQKKSSGILPAGYVQLAYIENTSNSYINTNVEVGDGITEYLTEVKWNAEKVNVAQSCGANRGGYFGARAGKYAVSNKNSNIVIGTENFDKVLFKRNYGDGYLYLSVNDNEQLDSQYADMTSTYKVFIFALSSYALGLSNCYFKCKYFKIKKDGVLVRDYIPCISPTQEVGMYDLVEGKFYGSASGTPFIAGNPI